jgi:predicted nucleic acid-binding Zn ribbon protein
MYNYNKPERDFRRKKDSLSIGDAIEHWMDQLRVRGKYKETFIIQNWEKIMGTPIAKRTNNLYIRNKKLYVHLSSAPLKNELNQSKHKVVELLNKAAEDKVLDDVVFL